MTADWKALCAELADELDAETGYTRSDGKRITHSTVARARAALAQPEPQGPTDEEARELANDLGITRGYFDHECGLHISCADLAPFAESVLTRWHRPAIEPVPVAERLPGPEDCNAEGRCWLGGGMFAPGDPTWVLGFPAWAKRFPEVYRFWLPAHALPVLQ